MFMDITLNNLCVGSFVKEKKNFYPYLWSHILTSGIAPIYVFTDGVNKLSGRYSLLTGCDNFA